MYGVHVINMERSRDKWDRCSRRFREKGFRVLRQEGYDVTTMDLSGYHTVAPRLVEVAASTLLLPRTISANPKISTSYTSGAVHWIGAQKYLDVPVDKAIGQTPNLRLMRVKPEITASEPVDEVV